MHLQRTSFPITIRFADELTRKPGCKYTAFLASNGSDYSHQRDQCLWTSFPAPWEVIPINATPVRFEADPAAEVLMKTNTSEEFFCNYLNKESLRMNIPNGKSVKREKYR